MLARERDSMSSLPAHSTIIRGAIERMIANIAGGRPARVESYDAAKQRAAVQPLVFAGRTDPATGDPVVERQPVITDVPILMLGTARSRTTIDIRPGDTVWVMSASCSLDRYLIQGGEVDPQDYRSHNISDAVAIPALFDFAHVPGDASTDGMILHTPRLRLGGPDASEAALKGTTYRAAEDTLIGAETAFLLALGVYGAALAALPGMSGPGATFATALSSYVTARTTYASSVAGPNSLSTVVQVK